MRHAGSINLYKYWNGLRGNRRAPTRSSIDPAHIRALLPSLFILEKTEDDEILFRLAGTQICTLFGQEFRGHAFMEAWDWKSGDRINDLVNHVLDTGNPVVMSARAMQPDQNWADIEVIVLPLASDLHNVDRLIGSIFVINQQRSLLNEPIQKMTLIGSRINLGEAVPELAISDAIYDEKRLEITPRKSPIGMFFKKVLHMRVFEGGKQE